MTDEKRAKRAAKRARREARKAAAAKHRYSKQDPLLLDAQVVQSTVQDSSLARFRPTLVAWARRIPSYGTSRGSKRRANELRIAAILIGIATALLAATAAVKTLGILLIVLAAALPLSPTRAARLEAQAAHFGSGKAVITCVQGQVVFDGRGVSVLLDGKTHARAHLTDGKYTLVACPGVDDGLLIKPNKSLKSKAVALLPSTQDPQTVQGAAGTALIDAADLATLKSAIVDQA